MRSLIRWGGPRLVPAVIALCLIVTAAVPAAVSASQPSQRAPVPRYQPPKPHKVPHTTARESRAVVRCLRSAHLKPVITSGVGFLWEGWIPKLSGFVYAQYYTTQKEATQQAKLLRREESGLVNKRIVISQHITPYVGSPVPKIVRCLHGRMITKQPKKKPGRLHF